MPFLKITKKVHTGKQGKGKKNAFVPFLHRKLKLPKKWFRILKLKFPMRHFLMVIKHYGSKAVKDMQNHHQATLFCN